MPPSKLREAYNDFYNWSLSNPADLTLSDTPMRDVLSERKTAQLFAYCQQGNAFDYIKTYAEFCDFTSMLYDIPTDLLDKNESLYSLLYIKFVKAVYEAKKKAMVFQKERLLYLEQEKRAINTKLDIQKAKDSVTVSESSEVMAPQFQHNVNCFLNLGLLQGVVRFYEAYERFRARKKYLEAPHRSYPVISLETRLNLAYEELAGYNIIRFPIERRAIIFLKEIGFLYIRTYEELMKLYEFRFNPNLLPCSPFDFAQAIDETYKEKTICFVDEFRPISPIGELRKNARVLVGQVNRQKTGLTQFGIFQLPTEIRTLIITMTGEKEIDKMTSLRLVQTFSSKP